MGLTASRRLVAVTAENCGDDFHAAAAKTAHGSHVFQISGYSGLRWYRPSDYCVRASSAVFPAGGYHWQILFFPGGILDCSDDHMSAYVALLSTNNHDIKVRASYRITILDVTGSAPPCTLAGTHEFDCSGDHKLKRRSELPPYLHNDRLTIECAITIVADDDGAKSSLPDAVPPSDIVQHLAKLLQRKENTDVTFMVGGQAFPAHKTVLAMRSPVFKDELYGTVRGNYTNPIIVIDDMQPVVFEALLHFIYTDSLPAPIDNLGGGQIIRHLLVAADRYAMERMKAVCEGILCEDIDVNTVATTLAFAHQHRCGRLIDACVQFIASLGKMQICDVMASQGYAELNAQRWEKACRLGRSQSSLHIGSFVA